MGRGGFGREWEPSRAPQGCLQDPQPAVEPSMSPLGFSSVRGSCLAWRKKGRGFPAATQGMHISSVGWGSPFFLMLPLTALGCQGSAWARCSSWRSLGPTSTPVPLCEVTHREHFALAVPLWLCVRLLGAVVARALSLLVLRATT